MNKEIREALKKGEVVVVPLLYASDAEKILQLIRGKF